MCVCACVHVCVCVCVCGCACVGVSECVWEGNTLSLVWDTPQTGLTVSVIRIKDIVKDCRVVCIKLRVSPIREKDNTDSVCYIETIVI